MLNNFSASCDQDFDAGGMTSPRLSLHSICGSGNQPSELHSNNRPLVLGGYTRIRISKLVAGWKERGKPGFLGEEKEKQNRERKAPLPTLIPVPLDILIAKHCGALSLYTNHKGNRISQAKGL